MKLKKFSHSSFTGNPCEVAEQREQALADGLRAFAKSHGIEFREPLNINSLGEFRLVVINPVDPNGLFCGQFGTAADIIAKHNPRTGVSPSKFMSPYNGWCSMNHFDVENLLESI